MQQGRNKKAPKPVKGIEVSEKHTKVKVIVLIVVLAIAIAAFTVGIVSCLSEDKGWHQVESTAGLDCSSDFTFYYYLEGGGTKGHTVLKGVTATYTQACYDAYRIFDAAEEHEGYNGVGYINAHPNEDIVVDPALYNAFASMKNANNRALYLAPIYGYYDSVLFSSNDGEAAGFYPIEDTEAAEIFNAVLGFALDGEQIELELLGNNTVRLNVSGEYRTFAYTNGIKSYIDFYMLKNAFIADYLAQKLKDGGCNIGTIASRDGFMRTLSNPETSSSLGIFDFYDGNVYRAANINFVGDIAAVRMRSFALGSERGLYYTFSDGTTVSRFIDFADGKVKTSMTGITSYGYGKTCADIALELYPVFVADEFDIDAPKLLQDKGIYSVYCNDNIVLYNDTTLVVADLLSSPTYTAKLV